MGHYSGPSVNQTLIRGQLSPVSTLYLFIIDTIAMWDLFFPNLQKLLVLVRYFLAVDTLHSSPPPPPPPPLLTPGESLSLWSSVTLHLSRQLHPGLVFFPRSPWRARRGTRQGRQHGGVLPGGARALVAERTSSWLRRDLLHHRVPVLL